MTEQNVERRKGFNQVCVWHGTTVGKDKVREFEKFMADMFAGTRIQYLEEIVTSAGDGGPGGRNDLFFAVHDADIEKFAVPRLEYAIRWIEDVLDNLRRRGGTKIYPARVKDYRTW